MCSRFAWRKSGHVIKGSGSVSASNQPVASIDKSDHAFLVHCYQGIRHSLQPPETSSCSKTSFHSTYPVSLSCFEAIRANRSTQD